MTTRKRSRRGNPKIKDFGVATRFKPGESGNPGGRSKTRVMAEMLCAIGNEVEPKTGKTFYQVAAEALLREANNGNVAAFKEFSDRVDGRTTQHVHLSGDLQVQDAPDKLETRLKAATTFEERQAIFREREDEILAAAEIIKAKRADTPENRYHDRMEEYTVRTQVLGEDPKHVMATYTTPAPS